MITSTVDLASIAALTDKVVRKHFIDSAIARIEARMARCSAPSSLAALSHERSLVIALR
jgi:hypothetical protein